MYNKYTKYLYSLVIKKKCTVLNNRFVYFILGVLELEGKFKDLKWSNKMLLCY